jgi:predicted enzyme related to lactoylglutathione lyase
MFACTFGDTALLIDGRSDVAAKNPEPGRVILNFHVDDARATAGRLNKLGVSWLVELEEREGGLFGTVIDPDGNYLQIIELKEA